MKGHLSPFITASELATRNGSLSVSACRSAPSEPLSDLVSPPEYRVNKSVKGVVIRVATFSSSTDVNVSRASPFTDRVHLTRFWRERH